MQIPTEFFEIIYEYCESRLELRAFAEGLPNRRKFCPPNDHKTISAFCTAYSQYNLYFGVGTRDDTGKGTKENVVEIPALWADIDFKDIDPVGVKKNLERFPFSPSVAILTGHGVHFYWLLREPAEAEDFPVIEDTLRRICAALTADPSACEVARVLRVPGTLNVKNEPVPVKVHRIENYRYNIEDFEILPQVEAKNKANGSNSTNAPGWIVEAFKGVPEGGNDYFPGRNVAATKIAGFFVNKLARKDISYLLECQNVHNVPPLTKTDLEKIILSVSKYRVEDRPLIVQQMQNNRSSQWQEVKKALGRT